MQQSTVPPVSISNLDWMVGTWQINNGNLYEEWIKMDQWLLGRSDKVELGDTVTLETMQITYRDEILHYIPTVVNQNDGQPILFPILRGAEEQVVFENKKHDFPQQIGYRKKGEKHIEAWIEGRNAKGESKKVTFDMKR